VRCPTQEIAIRLYSGALRLHWNLSPALLYSLQAAESTAVYDERNTHKKPHPVFLRILAFLASGKDKNIELLGSEALASQLPECLLSPVFIDASCCWLFLFFQILVCYISLLRCKAKENFTSLVATQLELFVCLCEVYVCILLIVSIQSSLSKDDQTAPTLYTANVTSS